MVTIGVPRLRPSTRRRPRNKSVERVNGEIKCCAEVVGVFPNDDATVCLAGALVEINDEWTVARRQMSLETIACVRR